MIAKTKAKSKSKVVTKAKVKAKPIKKLASKPVKKVVTKVKAKVKTAPKAIASQSAPKPAPRVETPRSEAPVKAIAKQTAYKPAPAPVARRIVSPMADRRSIKRTARVMQFNYMKAPGIEYEFQVGDTVEVFCDHEKNRERIRGWAKGIVVQVDNKMVAVQFRLNVFLTDGWMVPDRILWYPLSSEHIRPAGDKKPALKSDFIPDY